MGSFHLKSREKSISQLCEERKSIEKKNTSKERYHMSGWTIYGWMLFSLFFLFFPKLSAKNIYCFENQRKITNAI